MPQDDRNTPLCPHWSDPTQRCGIQNDGLFIPLDTYIENYCATSSYTCCFHLSDATAVDSEESIAEKIKRLQETIVGIK